MPSVKNIGGWLVAITLGIGIAIAIGAVAQPSAQQAAQPVLQSASAEQPNNSVQSSESQPAPPISVHVPNEASNVAPPRPSPAPMPPLPVSPGGIGYTVNDAPPVIVYPPMDDLKDDVIREIEDLQITKEQQDKIKQMYLNRQIGKVTPYVNVAKPVTRTLAVDLDPGVSPAVLRLSRGQLTSVVFSDTTGNPWMIEHVALNRTQFIDARAGAASGAGQTTQQPTNILSLEPQSPFAYGNVTVTLRGLATPVIFVLTSGQAEVDMRVDAKIPGHNPDAVAKIETESMPAIDADLGYFLDGVPPKSAKRLKTSGFEKTEAWMFNDKMYLRTSGEALNPAYLARARSTNGLSVYRFDAKHSYVIVTANGSAHTILID